MRSTAIQTVPSSGTTPIDFYIGPQNVGAVVIHNASYRTLTLTLTNGISRVIAADRSDLVTVGQATFDGHVTLTPGVLVASQTDAGSVWLDVYLPGERIDGTYPAPCANAMTGGNQQPRTMIVPMSPNNLFSGSTGNLAQNARFAALTIPVFGGAAQWPVTAHIFIPIYLYYMKTVPLLQAATTFQYTYSIEVEAQTAANAVIGGPKEIYRSGGLVALQGTTLAEITVDEYQPSAVLLGTSVFSLGSLGAPTDHLVFYFKSLGSSAVSFHIVMMAGVDLVNSGVAPYAIGEAQPANLASQYLPPAF